MLLHGNTQAGVADLPPPPPLAEQNSLFLDFDGTLIELADRPDGVVVGPDLVALLERLAERFAGRVAIVTGRSIAQIDHMLGDVAQRLAIAGSHGAERRTRDEGHVRPLLSPKLAEAVRRIEDFAVGREGLIVEVKSFGAGLHYRLAPDHGPDSDAFIASLAAEHDLVLQRGKMMAELRMPGDKGAALQAMLMLPGFAGTEPLFFGDDVTDEDGFAAAFAAGGHGVLVGEARPSLASYRLDDVPALHGWLMAGMEALA